MIENILEDFARAYGVKYAALRYFNACGADADGEIGEEHDPETHLIPRALMSVSGEIPHLDIFGDDHDTPDGTCIRDYVHVDDLANAHFLAVDHLARSGESIQLNIGSGAGHSVREVIATIDRVTGKRPVIVTAPRREGDPAALYADISKAKRILKYRPEFSDIEQIVCSAWKFKRMRRMRTEKAKG